MATAAVVAAAGPNLALPTPSQDATGDATATESVMISATVLSTDLFTPFQDPRVTLPTIG